MYDDAYPLFFEDRAMGQNIPGPTTRLHPYDFQYDYWDNRAVGQASLPMKSKFGPFSTSASENPYYETMGPIYGPGMPTPEPLDNPVVPTMIYGSPMPTFITQYGKPLLIGSVIVIGVLILLLFIRK